MSADHDLMAAEHLRSCPQCRTEKAQLEALSAVEEDGEWTPSPAHFRRVMAKVDAAERPAPSLWQRLKSWIEATPRPVRFFVGLQGAAVLALVALVLIRPPQVYETLSRQPAGAASQRARLHLVFEPDISESGLREVLLGAQAVIVDGPSQSGLYTVELSFDASDRDRAGQVAARIGALPKVKFAAPVAR